MSKSREAWVDNIKVFACILVAVGHFFQSMTNARIIPASELTRWFDSTIYYFHVPLFFLCSGYVYQKYSRVDSFSSWKKNVLKKTVTLGIPYFVFSIVTWLLKNVFSSAVNIENAGLLETLLVTPASPYWFLYILFFMFLITPTLGNKGITVIISTAAVVFKLISVWTGELPVYVVSKVFANGIWFVAGMVLAAVNVAEKICRRNWMSVGCTLAAFFLLLSVFVYDKNADIRVMPFLMGILGCAATVIIMRCAFASERKYLVWNFMAKYTMPVFLMHTIFAAGWRSVLLKLGITNAVVHIVSGLAISFIAPVIAAEIMKKVKFLDFFLNPGKYVKLDTKASHQENV